MAVLSTLMVVLAASGTLGSALPGRIGTPKAFSVQQVHNPTHVRHGPTELFRAYRKFGAPVPQSLHAIINANKAAVGNGSGSAVTTPEDSYDSEYLTPVSIGTPPQVLNLDFDTGSSDLWVFSSETSSSQVNGQTLYKPGSSTSAKKLSGATWSITYGDGSASSGDVYTDVVSIGGLTVTAQAVESAKKVSSAFTSDPSCSGLLGLAFSSLNTVSPTPQKTFFDNALSGLTQPVFTADLKHNAPGTYTFGTISSSAYTAPLSYVPVDTTQGFWTFTSSGYAVGTTTTLTKTSITGIADTGTTLLLLPLSVVKAYYAKVSGAKNSASEGGYVFPCSATLPAFKFGVGSLTVTVPGEYMNYAPVDESGVTCYGGIQDSSGIGINIFGDVALKAAFVVFDGGAERLGWAAKGL